MNDIRTRGNVQLLKMHRKNYLAESSSLSYSYLLKRQFLITSPYRGVTVVAFVSHAECES